MSSISIPWIICNENCFSFWIFIDSKRIDLTKQNERIKWEKDYLMDMRHLMEVKSVLHATILNQQNKAIFFVLKLYVRTRWHVPKIQCNYANENLPAYFCDLYTLSYKYTKVVVITLNDFLIKTLISFNNIFQNARY